MNGGALGRGTPTTPGDGTDTGVQKKEEAKVMKERAEKKWQKDHAYDEMFSEENMMGSSNQDRGSDWEDDFM
jgi:hypothetical protein